MPNNIPRPDFLNYDDIRSEVASFVSDFKISQEPPVDVEQIADAKLGLDIVPVPGLRASRDIEGYLSADRTAIYVDEPMATGAVLHRHRFTLAHEIGHWYLHEDLYEAAAKSGAGSFVEFINAIPEESWAWFEWQAYAFAGLLLVPRAGLRRAYEQAVVFASDRGFNLDPSIEAHRSYAAEWIGKRLQVSAEVVLKRAAKDELWK